jgi:hypothetical protein
VKKHVITFPFGDITAEAAADLARLWEGALNDRSKRTIILGAGATVTEIDAVPRRVWVKNAQRRLR